MNTLAIIVFNLSCNFIFNTPMKNFHFLTYPKVCPSQNMYNIPTTCEISLKSLCDVVNTDILASIAMIAITIISLILCLRRPFLKTR